MGRLEALCDWVTGYEGFDGLAKLNALVVNEGGAAVSATTSETVTARYIDGTEEREAQVDVRVAVPWSEGADELNPEAAELMEGWADWVRAQWPGNPPEIDGAEVTGIEPVYVMPQLEEVYESGRNAVYTLSVLLDFRTGE